MKCYDCGAEFKREDVPLGRYLCRPCDKERVHRIDRSMSVIAGKAADLPCQCLYCVQDRTKEKQS